MRLTIIFEDLPDSLVQKIKDYTVEKIDNFLKNKFPSLISWEYNHVDNVLTIELTVPLEKLSKIRELRGE